MKKALITGASSGIGKDIALYLDSLEYHLILVGRDEKKLEEVQKKCKFATIILSDLSNKEEVYRLYLKTKNEQIDILVNNAGFGLFGYFHEIELEKELEMINVNIIAVHMLTKLFVTDFIKRDSGYILNVASAAGFMAGPYLNTYYATKNYSLKLTLGLYEELKSKKSDVHVSALCPGPVDTNFNNIAGGTFKTKELSSSYVAKYGIDNLLKRKLIIIPSFKMKLSIILSKFIPMKLLLKITYNIQKNKVLK